jgi:hypothetical protein
MSDGLLQTRAMFAPETINVEARTVELVWTTGAKVKRADWARGDYMEELSLQAGAVRLDRLNKGAPLLDAHDSYSLRSQIGVVQHASVNGSEGRALVKFSKRAEVEPIFQDVIDGIYRNVSVGYKVHRKERDETGDMPVERAVDWEPYELSLVPIPADAGAQVRSEELTPTQPQERSMADNQGAPAAEAAPDTAIETRAEARGAEPTVTVGVDIQSAEQIRKDECRRADGILDTAAKLGVDVTVARKLIAEGVALDEARAQLIDARADTERRAPSGTSRVEVTLDHGEKRFEAKLDHLKARAGYGGEDQGGAREYRGSTLLDLCRDSLELAGISHRGMSKSDLAERALHSTSDFPLLMASIQRVSLKEAYAPDRQTWRPFAKQRNLPDFRDKKEMEVGGQIIPQEIKEEGEYKFGTIKEQQGSWSISEFGSGLKIGRRLIINDNLGYITRAVEVLGRGVATLEANMVWALITGNAKCMMDGVALFHASHNNTGTGVIGETSFSDAREKMYNQKGFEGTQLYVEARYILLPTSLLTTFEKFNTTITPNQTGDVNIFTNYVQPIVEPRLNGSPQWYLVGDGLGVENVVYGNLEGETGPTISSEIKRDPDGIVTYLRHDFGCMVPHHYGFYRSSGV